MNLTEYRRYANEYFVLDGAVPRGTITEWITNALYPLPRTSCEISHNDEMIQIPCSLETILPSLPKGYGIKGGAARAALRKILHPDTLETVPRDIDLVRYRGKASPLDWELAQQYMPDDAAQGRGVEHISSIPRYLHTRDITVNELLVLGSTLSVSFRGLLDTRAQILRPSRYRGGSIHAAKQLNGLTLAKMFRLKVEAESKHEAWEIAGIPEDQALSSFDIAVHLDRALSTSIDVARAFLDELHHERFLPRDSSTLEEWIEYLAGELPEGIAFFRHLPAELIPPGEEKKERSS